MKMDGVTEYCEMMNVELVQTTGCYESRETQKKGVGRWVILAKNEGGCNSTEVDVLELIAWLKSHRPDLLE